jgi:hypothetical protein
VQKTVHLPCKIVGRTCGKLAMAQLEFTLRGKLRKRGRMNTAERLFTSCASGPESISVTIVSFRNCGFPSPSRA